MKLSTAQDKEKGVYVAGAKEHPVETEDELLQVMQVGISKLAPQTNAPTQFPSALRQSQLSPLESVSGNQRTQLRH